MATHCDGFFGLVDAAYEFLGFLFYAQEVSVQSTSRQKDGIELVGIGFVERHVNANLAAFLVVLESRNLSGLRRDDERLRAGLFESFSRPFEFSLCETIAGYDSNAHVRQFLL